MSLNYRGFNFIIFDYEEKISSGAYFVITKNDDQVFATMLKDINFSLIAKEKYKYDIYLAKGNLYSSIEKIKLGDLNEYKICSFNTDNFLDLSNENINIKFYQNDCPDGLFLSNPLITFERKFLDDFIDNL